jgi:nickel-type superoxide dismutase maturation protease
MEPTLTNGEWWVVRRTRSVRAGDVVLLIHPTRPDLRIVKRIERNVDAGWWVMGDNPAASDDSRSFGAVRQDQIVGRLWFRYGRDPRRQASNGRDTPVEGG